MRCKGGLVGVVALALLAGCGNDDDDGGGGDASCLTGGGDASAVEGGLRCTLAEPPSCASDDDCWENEVCTSSGCAPGLGPSSTCSTSEPIEASRRELPSGGEVVSMAVRDGLLAAFVAHTDGGPVDALALWTAGSPAWQEIEVPSDLVPATLPVVIDIDDDGAPEVVWISNQLQWIVLTLNDEVVQRVPAESVGRLFAADVVNGAATGDDLVLANAGQLLVFELDTVADLEASPSDLYDVDGDLMDVRPATDLDGDGRPELLLAHDHGAQLIDGSAALIESLGFTVPAGGRWWYPADIAGEPTTLGLFARVVAMSDGWSQDRYRILLMQRDLSGDWASVPRNSTVLSWAPEELALGRFFSETRIDMVVKFRGSSFLARHASDALCWEDLGVGGFAVQRRGPGELDGLAFVDGSDVVWLNP